MLKLGKEDRDHVLGQEWRPVVGSGVDPSEEEVVVAVWETYSLVEEFLCSCLVELMPLGVAEGHPGDVEVGILSLEDPVFPLGALEAVSGPVPGILRLADVKFAVESERNHRVS